MNKDLQIRFSVEASALQSLERICDIQGWWSTDFCGSSSEVGDEFEVRFADVHYSKHRMIEKADGTSVSWLVTDSKLNFLKQKDEWTGTTMRFEIQEKGGQTDVVFTHEGLSPQLECFRDCSNGWNHYILGSLLPFINTGKGNPNVLESEIKKKSVSQ